MNPERGTLLGEKNRKFIPTYLRRAEQGLIQVVVPLDRGHRFAADRLLGMVAHPSTSGAPPDPAGTAGQADLL